MPTLAVYLPAFNEADTIGALLDAIPSDIPGITTLKTIVVNDGSTDGTAEVARAHGAHVVRSERNRGTGRAFVTGVQASLDEGADIIVSMDADGQFAPADIAKLVAPMRGAGFGRGALHAIRSRQPVDRQDADRQAPRQPDAVPHHQRHRRAAVHRRLVRLPRVHPRRGAARGHIHSEFDTSASSC